MIKAFYSSKEWALWAYGGLGLLLVSLFIQVQFTVAFNSCSSSDRFVSGRLCRFTSDIWRQVSCHAMLSLTLYAYFLEPYDSTMDHCWLGAEHAVCGKRRCQTAATA